MTYYFDKTDKYDYVAITHHCYPSFAKQRKAAEILLAPEDLLLDKYQLVRTIVTLLTTSNIYSPPYYDNDCGCLDLARIGVVSAAAGKSICMVIMVDDGVEARLNKVRSRLLRSTHHHLFSASNQNNGWLRERASLYKSYHQDTSKNL